MSVAFLRWAKKNVAESDFRSYRLALKILRKRFPHLPVSEFGPVALAAVQGDFVKAGYARG